MFSWGALLINGASALLVVVVVAASSSGWQLARLSQSLSELLLMSMEVGP